ncbi:MAG: winged helix-turn-helix transcriptional regulator, partial [Oceanospirillales bacterium]|nr:winged helix-turn-helix transcriptional regulator [Oceanospirillales bacterium]
GEVELKLTPSGWQILETLLRASPDPVSRQVLERALWGDDLPESNVLKVHMHHLRKVVDKQGLPPLIHTLSGYGFQIREPVHDQT